MSKKRRSYGNAAHTGNRSGSARGNDRFYVYGNTAAQLQRQLEEEPAKKPSAEVKKNRAKAHYMSAGYLLFLGAALVASAYILMNYLQMQAELTNLTKSVAAKTSTLINLKTDNEEEYNRIVSSIDLEELKRVAMGVLGMIYAQEGQIVVYEGEQYDYMRQVTESGR